jgi:hypothetical protein
MKIPITIEAEIECPEYTEGQVRQAITDNFILHLPAIVQGPFVLRYLIVRETHAS